MSVDGGNVGQPLELLHDWKGEGGARTVPGTWPKASLKQLDCVARRRGLSLRDTATKHDVGDLDTVLMHDGHGSSLGRAGAKIAVVTEVNNKSQGSKMDPLPKRSGGMPLFNDMERIAGMMAENTWLAHLHWGDTLRAANILVKASGHVTILGISYYLSNTIM